MTLLLWPHIAQAQTTETVTATVRDLGGNVIPTGQITFELKPSIDTTISGNARFTPITIACSINQSQTVSLTATGGVVTATFTSPHTFIVGDAIQSNGWSDSSFDGSFTVATVADNLHLTWNASTGASATGGYISALRQGSVSGAGQCTITQNTALTPSGTFYNVCIWPAYSKTSCFNFYALSATVDLSNVTPTPGEIPAYPSSLFGANTTLSNLVAPTAVNQDLLPKTPNSGNVGTAASPFGGVDADAIQVQTSQQSGLGLTWAFNAGAAVAPFTLVKFDANGNIVPTTNADTSGLVGVAESNAAGLNSSVSVVLLGPVTLQLDGACTANQPVINSSTAAPAGHCTSTPGTNQIIGTSLTTSAGAGSGRVHVAIGAANSGGSPPAGSQYAMQYNAGGGLFGGVAPAATNGLYYWQEAVTGSAAVAPALAQVGLGSRALGLSATSDTVTFLDAEGTIIYHPFNASGTVNPETLPTATTLGNPNAVFKYCNFSPQTDVIVPTTWTIQAGSSSAASSLNVAPGVCYTIVPDPSNATNWIALLSGAGSASVTGTQYQVVTMTGTNAAAGNSHINTDASNDLNVGGALATQNPTNTPSFCAGASNGCIGSAEGTCPTDTTAGIARQCPDATQGAWATQISGGDFIHHTGTLCANVTPVLANTNTTGIQNLMACTFAAGDLNATLRSLHVHLAGVSSTQSGQTPTFTLGVELCSVSGCGSGTVITPCTITSGASTASSTNNGADLFCDITTQTAGTSAAFEAHGQEFIDLGASPTSAASVYLDSNHATVGTINSQAIIYLQSFVTISTNTATPNTFQARQLIVEATN